MKKIAIVGCGGHARVILSEILKSNKYHVIGFIDEEKDIGTLIEKIDGVTYEVIANLSNASFLSNDDTHVIIGIGTNFTRMNVKEEIIKIHRNIKWGTVISEDSVINGNVHIGEGSVILSGSIINNGTIIGEHCIIGTNVSVDHDNTTEDFVSLGPRSVTAGNVKISLCSHIGASTTINQNIVIGEHTIIGSKSLCTKNCDSNSIYLGIPAIKSRSRELSESYL